MIEFLTSPVLMFGALAGVPQPGPALVPTSERIMPLVAAPLSGPSRLRRPVLTQPPRRVEPGHSGPRGQLV